MPIFRRYEETVRDLPRRKLSQSVCAYYDAILLHFFEVGTYGEAVLYAVETVQSVSRELCEACARRKVGVQILSEHRGTVFFKIIAFPQTEMDLYANGTPDESAHE